MKIRMIWKQKIKCFLALIMAELQSPEVEQPQYMRYPIPLAESIIFPMVFLMQFCLHM